MCFDSPSAKPSIAAMLTSRSFASPRDARMCIAQVREQFYFDHPTLARRFGSDKSR